MSNKGPCTAKATNTIARSGIEREYLVSAELNVMRSSPLAAVWIQKDYPGFTRIFTSRRLLADLNRLPSNPEAALSPGVASE
jgi:hypothetical protein